MSTNDTRTLFSHSGARQINQRRAQRVQIAMPIRVSGAIHRTPFDELTATVTVSAHGCLVHLKAAVAEMQQLLIVNPATQQQVHGTVVFIEGDARAPREVGVEFAVPSPLFWGITFPPEDWDPAERKLPPRRGRG
jgi:PilZ domain